MVKILKAFLDYFVPAAGILCVGIFGASIILAMLNPGWWPTYQIIIEKFTYPTLMLGIGLLTGRYVR